MKDLNELKHYPLAEKVVDALVQQTQSNNRSFFRIVVAYYLAKVASMMRVNVHTEHKGLIPVNMYAINLAVSGFGKGFSTNILEDRVINRFKDRFTNETMELVAEKSLYKLAIKRAQKKQTDPDTEHELVKAEYERLGALAFSFDSGTTAAVKQMRHKLLMADAGSMNLEIDEIGSNLLGNVDVLNTFLELFDVGKVKQKLVKNTNDNIRSEEIDGKTPTNLMLYGTPTKLLNASKTEDEFRSMLDAGYARRCFFGYTLSTGKNLNESSEELFNRLTSGNTDQFLDDLSVSLHKLADEANFGATVYMEKKECLTLIDYQLHCERLAASFGDHEESKKAEVSHRHFKAMKLAGAYAFISGSSTVTREHLESAIKLTEESGEAFNKILKRDKDYVRLAKYISEVGQEVTHADLVEDLPFYKGSEASKREMMTLAIAYGYKNNIIIKKSFNEGIEFLRGESLKQIDLDKIIVSHSNHYSDNYSPEYAPFDKLHQLTQLPNHHWANHHFIDAHRKEDCAISGFNCIVIDVDEGTPVDTARLLLRDYKYLIHTTKRHTDAANRYRIIMPMTHELKMDAKEFKEFMENIYEWLPFGTDDQTNQRSRKWETFKGMHWYNEGKLIDALNFIPKTTKNTARKKVIDGQQSLDNLERWFINNTGDGNRNNQLIKFALMLVDAGKNISEVQNQVLAFNAKLADKLEEAEVMTTILVSASKAIHKRDTRNE